MNYKNDTAQNNIIYDEWNPWTEKSKNTLFREGQQGHGENKLAKEFNTNPLGQNVSHDLNILGEKWECKERDTDGSFRVGVESQAKFGELVSSLVNLFDIIKRTIPLLIDDDIKKNLNVFKSSIFENLWGRSRTTIYDGFKKAEVSEANLNQTDSIISRLISLIHSGGQERTIELWSPLGQIKSYCIEDAYELLRLDRLETDSIIEKLGNNYNLAIIRSALKPVKNFRNTNLKSGLNDIVRSVFSDKVLVFVHETNGYRPVRNLKPLECYRITHGGPRCKYIL